MTESVDVATLFIVIVASDIEFSINLAFKLSLNVFPPSSIDLSPALDDSSTIENITLTNVLLCHSTVIKLAS